MKVSVITACRNSAQTIKETIESVKRQSYKDIEHIICDGDSSDSTLEIIKSYNGSVKLINGPDDGIYDAMNKGISAATGDIVAILNSEDFYTHDSIIQSIVDEFIAYDADAVYGDLFYVDAEDTSKIVRYWKTGQFSQDKFLDGWMIPHPSLFMKKSLYEKYGYYRTGFNISGDYEMMLRVFMRNNITVRYIQEVFVKMRMGGKSNSSLLNRFKANREDKKAWRINDLVPHPLTMVFKPLRKIGQYFWKTPVYEIHRENFNNNENTVPEMKSELQNSPEPVPVADKSYVNI